MCLFSPFFPQHGIFRDTTPPTIVRIIGSDFQIPQAGPYFVFPVSFFAIVVSIEKYLPVRGWLESASRLSFQSEVGRDFSPSDIVPMPDFDRVDCRRLGLEEYLGLEEIRRFTA